MMVQTHTRTPPKTRNKTVIIAERERDGEFTCHRSLRGGMTAVAISSVVDVNVDFLYYFAQPSISHLHNLFGNIILIHPNKNVATNFAKWFTIEIFTGTNINRDMNRETIFSSFRFSFHVVAAQCSTCETSEWIFFLFQRILSAPKPIRFCVSQLFIRFSWFLACLPSPPSHHTPYDDVRYYVAATNETNDYIYLCKITFRQIQSALNGW